MPEDLEGGGTQPPDTGKDKDKNKSEASSEGKPNVPAEQAPQEARPIDYKDIGASKPEIEFLQPKEEDAEEVKLLKSILAESMLHRIQGMQALGQMTMVLNSQRIAMYQLVDKFSGVGDASAAEAMQKKIDATEKSLNENAIEFNDLLNKLYGAIENENKFILDNRMVTAEFLETLEQSQNIPESLKNPTLERMRKQLSDRYQQEYKDTTRTETLEGREVKTGQVDGRDWNETNPVYQTMVRDWLREHLINMESKELAFEEQPDVYRYLSLYANNFALTEGTRDYGEELVDMLEKRRILHRLKRVESFSPPDVVLAELGKINTSTLADFFRDEIVKSYVYDEKGDRVIDKKTGEYKLENHVALELKNYERMMRIIREKKIKYRRLYLAKEEDYKKTHNLKKLSPLQKKEMTDELKDLGDEIKTKQQYLIDYYRYGGSVYDEGLNGSYIGNEGKWNEADTTKGVKSNDNENGFFYKLGELVTDADGNRVYRKKINGKNIEIIKDKDGNPVPVGSYSQSELISNFIKKENKKVGDKKERMYRDRLWARKYAGGLSSVLFRVSREAQLNGTVDFYADRILNFGEALSNNFLMRNSKEFFDPTRGSYKEDLLSLEYVDIMTSYLDSATDDQLEKVGIKNKKLKDHNGSFLSLENLDWGSEKLWDELIINGLNSKEGQPAIRGTYFKEADDARKFMWGPDSYTHRMTTDGMAKIETLGTYMGTGPYKDENGNFGYEIRGTGKKVNVSQLEAWQIDKYDRSLEWLKSDEAENWLGNPLTGYARTAEIRKWINTLVRNGMIDGETRSILLTKHLGTSNRFILDRMVEISVLWNDFKQNRGAMMGQGFVEFLKRAFGYTFGDELR